MSTEPQRTRGQFLRDLANPRHKTGGYVLPHISALGVIVLLTVLIYGVFAIKIVYDQHYFASRYQAPLKLPAVSAPVYVPKVAVPADASINVALYPAAGDQDGQGSCAAFASAWSLSYEYRRAHPGSWLRFSPRYLYDHYSDTYNGGQDAGSWPTQNLETVPSTGLPKYRQFPYPPNVIDNPIPLLDAAGGSLADDAAHYRLPLTVTDQVESTGAGQAVIDLAKQDIAAGHAPVVAIEVASAFDNATNTNGQVDQGPGGASRGGHAVVIIAYNDNYQFADGAVGGVEIQNQWAHWGLHNSRAWLSYNYLRNYGFGLVEIALNPSTSKASPEVKGFVPNNGKHTHNIVPPSFIPPTKLPSVTAWRTKDVYTKDTRYNLAPLINYWGTKYGVWPVGLVAVAATESGLNQYADRCCTPGDTSYGTFQFTLETACAYGVCSDIRNQLDNPQVSVELAARYLRDAQITTCLRFPWLYSAYNQGSYLGCNAYAYYHPSGQAAINYFGNWISNYNYVVATYSDYGPAPKPKPFVFPQAKWGPLPHLYHGHLSWAASVWLRHQTLGKNTHRGVWHPRPRHGFTTTLFQQGIITTWPSYHAAKVRDCYGNRNACE